MSRNAFPAIEREYNEQQDRLAEIRANRLRHEEELAAPTVKAERDEALKLLRRVLDVREMGVNGPMKSDIRDFLKRVA